METTTLQGNIIWLLMRASMASKQSIMKLADTHDLSMMQALTLCLLEPGHTIPMSRMSGLLVCDPSNITGIVDRLTQGKLIERRESSTDRRVKTIGLTDFGSTVREEFMIELNAADAATASNLSATDIKSLKKLLSKMVPML
jgi:DNA-binding MarR family transcriptional regulator